MKLKKSAGDALTAFAEKTSLQFVLNQGTFMLLSADLSYDDLRV